MRNMIQILAAIGATMTFTTMMGCAVDAREDGELNDVDTQEDALGEGSGGTCDTYNAYNADVLKACQPKVLTSDGYLRRGQTATVEVLISNTSTSNDPMESMSSYPGAVLSSNKAGVKIASLDSDGVPDQTDPGYAFSGLFGVGPGQSFKAKWLVTVPSTVAPNTTILFDAFPWTGVGQRAEGPTDGTCGEKHLSFSIKVK